MSTAAKVNVGSPFSALLAFADAHELKAADLVGAIRQLYPGTRVTGWGGLAKPDEAAQGVMLSVEGVDLAVLNLRVAAPAGAFDAGNQPAFYWQGAGADIQQHKSHMFVIEAEPGPVGRSITRAGVVTIVTDAIASLAPMTGVLWESARNLVRGDNFAKLMTDFRGSGQIPVGLWIRLLAAYTPPATAGAAGTFGLHAFGSPDIEVHASHLGYADCLAVALSYAQNWLTTGAPLWKETTTGIEKLANFRVERLANGLFGVGAVTKLTEVVGADKPPRPGEAPFREAGWVFRTAEDKLPPGRVLYNRAMRDGIGRIHRTFYDNLKLASRG